jgi:hypothetical protein
LEFYRYFLICLNEWDGYSHELEHRLSSVYFGRLFKIQPWSSLARHFLTAGVLTKKLNTTSSFNHYSPHQYNFCICTGLCGKK